MKNKRTRLLVFSSLLVVLFLAVGLILKYRGPDSFTNQVFLQAEDCRELILRHEDSFNDLILALEQCFSEGKEIGSVTFDAWGRMNATENF